MPSESAEIIRQYADRIQGVSPETLHRVSIREQARIIQGGSYQGVPLRFLDLTTGAASGTFKDWVACLTIAHCLEHGIGAFVTQSSGNTANALALYAERHGVSALILYPKFSRYKIHPLVRTYRNITCIEVDLPEPRIKDLTVRLSQTLQLPWLPLLSHQMEANKLRAWFLQDYQESAGSTFSWHAQALSSAYGVLGCYKGLDEMRARGVALRSYPRFCGVQQEAVAPFFEFVSGMSRNGARLPEMMEPTLFRQQPTQELLAGLKSICDNSNGLVTVLTNEHYQSYEAPALRLLQEAGIKPTRIQCANEDRIIEKAGIIATAGVFKEIDRGTIRGDEPVLVAITGGVSKRDGTLFEPELRFGANDEISALVDWARKRL